MNASALRAVAAACITWALVAICTVQIARGDEIASPFVAGFDRFGRAATIEPPLAGELLLSELSCTACHATPDQHLQPKGGPRLSGAGRRLQHDWLRRYLLAPQQVKPGTTMPDLLASLPAAEREPAAGALAAFLMTQREPFPELVASGTNPLPHEFWRKGNPQQGQRLYHQVGCVACHEPDPKYEGGSPVASALDQLLTQLDPEEIEELGLGDALRPVRSVPHGQLGEKYTHMSLTHFLLDPLRVRPAGRMPDCKLAPVEAADIAAYLLRDRPAADEPTVSSDDAGQIAEGRRLFAELQCVACHASEGVRSTHSAKPLTSLDANAPQGCLAAPLPSSPRFGLDPLQVASLRTALTATKPTTSRSATQRADFVLLQMNCYACHQRDGRGGVGYNRQNYFETAGHVDLGDEGRLPPPLTVVGGKLKPAWFKKVLDGSGDIRPHLLARMPKFPSVAALPDLLAAADETAIGDRQPLTERPELAEAGRALLDTGCVQCHPVRGERLPSVVGVDLQGIAGRVQPDWFYRFLRNPMQLKPRTRMPTFFPDGRAANQEVLGGDVDRQIAAMWSYLAALERYPLPEKIEQARSQDYELIPVDKPLLLRTFMKQAGTQAIAVGFPGQIHAAFDAENVRWAQVWRGRFLDAHGTWVDRSAPPAEPLGQDVIALPPYMPFAVLDDQSASWPALGGEQAGYRFSGYRLDRAGVPTFLYRFGEFDIEDRIEPTGDRGLRRQLHITPLDSESTSRPHRVWFLAHVGASLARRQPGAYTDSRGLTVRVADSLARQAETRTWGNQTAWVIPLSITAATDLEVEYTW